MSKLEEDIIKLRLLNNTYDYIKKELECSKSTISHHCNKHGLGNNYINNGNPVEYIEIKCKYCGNIFETKIKTSIFCGHSCSTTYNNNLRREERFKTLDKYKIYREECKFKFNVYDFPKEFDLSIIDKYGWYSAKNRGNNYKGISRDHRISIVYGWNNNIPSNIIAHPSNCELIKQNDNAKKNIKCSINIDELNINIIKFNNLYKSIDTNSL